MNCSNCGFQGGNGHLNWICSSAWSGSSINWRPATLARSFCGTSQCLQRGLNQPDMDLLGPGMRLKLAQGRPQNGQNHGWRPQIWACGTFQHHIGSVSMVKPSTLVTLMDSPCLDYWVRTVLVDELQQLWFSAGGERSNWSSNSVWSSSNINSEHGTMDPFVAPLNAP